MTLTNSLVNTQSAPININLSNNDLKKLEKTKDSDSDFCYDCDVNDVVVVAAV
jgi:hypothetical protein